MRRTPLSGVRRVLPLNGAVASDVGSVRVENEDRVALVRGFDRWGRAFVLAALADGIGGLKAGGECAALTLGAFIDSVVTDALFTNSPAEWLSQSAQRANAAVHAQYGGRGGATLAAVLLVRDHSPLWLSIGDSRVYHSSEAGLKQLSRDDTLEGQLGKPDAGHRPDLLQFVGIGNELVPHVDTVNAQGGTVLLTTDGVHFIDPDCLAKVIHHAPDLGVCSRRLVDLAKMLGGPDNASVAMLNVGVPADDDTTHLDDLFEVWDPFGELQVMFEREPRKNTPTYHRQHSVAFSPKAAEESRIAEKTVTAKAEPQKKIVRRAMGVKNAPKTKKAKVASRKRAVGNRGAKEHEGTDVPQLLIEFPNKSP